MKLLDRYGRSIDYVRISITDRCDLRCGYCIPEGFKAFDQSANWLSPEEIFRIAKAFTALGTRKFRITGGEPLLRSGVVDLIGNIASLDQVDDVSLTTNGTQLSRFAKPLFDAGLNRINVSLDSLREQCVQTITGKNSLQSVIRGLEEAKRHGFKQIKINMVPLAGINQEDIEPMIAFCIENGFILSLIEVMPMGDSARRFQAIHLPEILNRLIDQYQLQQTDAVFGNGPARYWRSLDNDFKLGLITPMSQHFCETCNRVRLSSDGTIYTCLGHEHNYPLKPLLRAGCSDEALQAAIVEAIQLKPEKHEFNEKPEKIIRIMAKTGG